MITLCMLLTLFGDLVLFFNKLNLLPLMLLKPVICVGFKVGFWVLTWFNIQRFERKFLKLTLQSYFSVDGQNSTKLATYFIIPGTKYAHFSWKRERNNPNMILNVRYIKKALNLMYCLGAKWSSKYMSNHNLCGAWDSQGECAVC